MSSEAINSVGHVAGKANKANEHDSVGFRHGGNRSFIFYFFIFQKYIPQFFLICSPELAAGYCSDVIVNSSGIILIWVIHF